MKTKIERAVLLPIHPHWCVKIADGEKTIEIRKNAPKAFYKALTPKGAKGPGFYEPFKVYIYRTLEKWGDIHHTSGKVIGEFICDKVDAYTYDEHIGYPTPHYEGDDSFCDCGEGYWITCGDLAATCLTNKELMDYGNKKTLYGWHISNLVIYDKPKELSDFYGVCPHGNCENCVWGNCKWRKPIQKAPQSFCYVGVPVEGGTV